MGNHVKKGGSTMKRSISVSAMGRLVFFSLLMLCLFQPQMAWADPPQGVQLKYNLNAQILFVTITHSSLMNGSHYVKWVEIKKNGRIVSIQTYKEQPASDTFTYLYKIQGVEDDTFEVTAACNLYGTKSSAALTVTK
jgi:hypothetical protein